MNRLILLLLAIVVSSICFKVYGIDNIIKKYSKSIDLIQYRLNRIEDESITQTSRYDLEIEQPQIC